jgi:hypothetical protein
LVIPFTNVLVGMEAEGRQNRSPKMSGHGEIGGDEMAEVQCRTDRPVAPLQE